MSNNNSVCLVDQLILQYVHVLLVELINEWMNECNAMRIVLTVGRGKRWCNTAPKRVLCPRYRDNSSREYVFYVFCCFKFENKPRFYVCFWNGMPNANASLVCGSSFFSFRNKITENCRNSCRLQNFAFYHTSRLWTARMCVRKDSSRWNIYFQICRFNFSYLLLILEQNGRNT